MRKLLGAIVVAVAALIAGQGLAADFPDYDIEVPEVDYGLAGSFYLRGSAALNMMTARDVTFTDPCACLAPVVSPVTGSGYGYSFGAGFGYETGDGLRGDVTIDYLSNSGMTDGTYALELRSTIALANAYYDFNFGGGSGSAAGGFGAYVGAGIGAAYNQTHVTGPGAGPDGANFAAAGALMAGVTYDMGDWVADVGYRLIYMPQITNGSSAMLPAATPYYVNQNFINELRGTVRYRFN
jgi:hypothetical protein